MIASQAESPRPIPSQQEIVSAVVLLRSFAPATLASAVRNGFDVETLALAGGRSRGAGLAPWQLKRAKALFEAHLCGGVGVEHVARACGLSRGHFSNAFRVSTGLSPHCWFTQRRIEAARDMLRTNQSLSDIALACGFADQSHFTRQFRRATGTTPKAWQRLCLAGA
jgi:AraC-like DNA-binding protein